MQCYGKDSILEIEDKLRVARCLFGELGVGEGVKPVWL